LGPKYWEPRRHDHNAVLSKLPFVSTHGQLIQTDHGRDQWQRTAEHVRLQIGAAPIAIFNFDNTYNWFNNDYQYEISGLVAFRNYVTGLLGVVTVNDGGNLVMGGDFNLQAARQQRRAGRPIEKQTKNQSISAIELTPSQEPITVAAFSETYVGFAEEQLAQG
jgi:hypothetical protein